jgi:16S rRNA pseudouridine516 synthase
MGLGSRKEVKILIRKGLVSVNGHLVVDDDFKVDETQDEVVYLDQSLQYPSQQYFMLNKPADTICSNEVSLYRSVLDLFEEVLLPSTQAVGRLDVDTTGLLLVSSDGQVAHRCLSSKHHVEKVYEVLLKDDFDLSYLDTLEKGGILLDGEACLPAKVQLLSSNRLLLSLIEGRYHQVKRMMHACNNEVQSLKRIQFGPLKLDPNLALGQYRALSTEEIKAIKDI